MSDLRNFRDYALKRAADRVASTSEAALWLQLAGEIDEYLAGPAAVEDDLFGDLTTEPDPQPTQQPGGGESEMGEQTTRLDTLRHKVGVCPACREYLWADVLVEARMSEPTLTESGKAAVYASAAPVGMTVEHKCEPPSGGDEEAGAA